MFVWEEWHFIIISQSHNYYISWFFCCIFMVFHSISFKPQKVWGTIVNLPLYKFSASWNWRFTPVGVTTYWCYFSWIIANIFVIVHRILAKRGTKMCPIHHLFVFQISRLSDNLFPLYGNFNTFTKRIIKKKIMKKLSLILEVRISETPGAI